MARPERSSQAFPALDSQTPKRRRVVRLKFTPPVDWRSTLKATLTRLPWRRASGMKTITTGHFQWLACRHSPVHLTGLT
jgi:hypothetical protein